MTDANGFGDDCASNSTTWAADYDRDLMSNVIPYVEAHYNVSKTGSDRAYAGLSCGGILTASLGLKYTSQFGYYGVMSLYQGGPQANVTPALLAALHKVGLFVGGGLEDPIHSVAEQLAQGLQAYGLQPTTDFIHGGHDWFVWRVLLRDFLTRVAFKPVT